jgi:hypothetical protein
MNGLIRPFADGVDGAPNGIKRAKMVVVASAIWKGAVRGQVYHRYLVCHARVGLDLAKRVFRIHAVDATGSVVIARSVNRRTLLTFFDALPRCVVAMEACSSAHHWGRQLLAGAREALRPA